VDGFLRKLTGNYSWRGGSARAAVRGYITRKGKRVKAHTRKVAGKQALQVGQSIVGPAALRVVLSGESWKHKIGSLLIVALGGVPPGTQVAKAKGRSKRR
jgi:hypothetical protein